MLLIGLDAASNLSKFGYAIGHYEKGRVAIQQAGLVKAPVQADALTTLIAPAIRQAPSALIAIDAPLGWPIAMAKALQGHRAGNAFSFGKDAMFHRKTDQVVHDLIDKKPLEVGADKIARAAHSALSVLQDLRDKSGKAIPLAWRRIVSGVEAIEVYPAATLKVRGLPHSGYKKPENMNLRLDIARGLSGDIDKIDRYADGSDDIFDACLCLVAAKDFLDGVALPPADMETAIQEGWIWVRNP